MHVLQAASTKSSPLSLSFNTPLVFGASSPWGKKRLFLFDLTQIGVAHCQLDLCLQAPPPSHPIATLLTLSHFHNLALISM